MDVVITITILSVAIAISFIGINVTDINMVILLVSCSWVAFIGPLLNVNY